MNIEETVVDTVKESKELVRYIPILKGRKWITRTTDTPRNGGLYSQEKFKKATKMMEVAAHTFRNPRLHHICFTGAAVLEHYQLVVKRFCRALEAEGVQHCYKAALEHDSKKGLHFHLMIVLGTGEDTNRFITGKNEAGKIENESLLRKAVRHTWDECATLQYRVCSPHSQKVPYIQFSQSNQAKFTNAVEWLSYIYKKNTKPVGRRVIFSSQREENAY